MRTGTCPADERWMAGERRREVDGSQRWSIGWGAVGRWADGLDGELDGLRANEAQGRDVVDGSHVTRPVPLQTDVVNESEENNSFWWGAA